MTPGTASLAELFADTPEELRRQALAHSSWVETRTDSYGRLAFLGDSVLGLSVAALLYERHPECRHRRAHQDPQPGGQRPRLRRGRARAGAPRAARRAGAGATGDGLPVETLLASERTLASVCEAVIGACYLAHGFERTSAAVVGRLRRGGRAGDPRAARLQVRAPGAPGAQAARPSSTRSRARTGRRTTAASRSGRPCGGDELGVGSGRSKKEAEQAAAERALEKLRGKPSEPARAFTATFPISCI